MKHAQHILALALCLISSTASLASAQEVIKEADVILAEDQTLPLGITLLPGTQLIHLRSKSDSSKSGDNFAVKIPSVSGHKGFWAGEYVKQLDLMGWSSTEIPDMMHMLNRKENGCSEQLYVIELGPNMSELMKANSKNMPIYDFDLIAFSYSKTGDCKAVD